MFKTSDLSLDLCYIHGKKNPSTKCCYLATWALWKAQSGRHCFFLHVHVQKMSKPKSYSFWDWTKRAKCWRQHWIIFYVFCVGKLLSTHTPQTSCFVLLVTATDNILTCKQGWTWFLQQSSASVTDRRSDCRDNWIRLMSLWEGTVRSRSRGGVERH